MKNIARERDGICLSKEYQGVKYKLFWQCNKNHKWYATPDSILSGSWCPICANKNRGLKRAHTLDHIQQTAMRRGGRCLSKVYINNQSKLLWECSATHRWEAKPSHVLAGHWCPVCAGVAKNTIEKLQDIAHERGGECLSNAYVNARINLKWKCKFGHTWEATASNVTKGTWCPKCWGKNATINDMKIIAEERGGKCLSDKYVNSMTKLIWECSEGHRWKAPPNSIKAGRWCPECSPFISERICREAFEQIFKKKFPKARPKWLKNSMGNQMELDGYCESLKLAFEHQGEQHYSTKNPFINTEDKLQDRIKDDILKQSLCITRGIKTSPYKTITGQCSD